MILTLAILWVILSVVFFGSLALAAGKPLPALDRQALLDDPVLREYEPEFSERESASYAHLETIPS